jgi:hypothetical protein
VPPQTAVDRALQLIRESPDGRTAGELRSDDVLSKFGASTVSRLPARLRDKGLIEAAGDKREHQTVWRIVAQRPEHPPKESDAIRERKVKRIIANLMNDPDLRDGVREGLKGQKGWREALAVVRAVDKEDEAARLAEEKRVADEEKERVRMLELSRSTRGKSIKAWEALTTELRTSREILVHFSRLLDDLPAVDPAFVYLLDKELQGLQRQIDRLEDKLRGRIKGGTGLSKGAVIDASSR